MNRFAFIIHPIQVSDFARKFAFARHLPEALLEGIFKYVPPMKVSHITGIKSPTGAEAEGWFIGCPLSTRQMIELPEEFVLNKIIQGGKLGEKLGASIIGLGAFTAVVGDGGITVSKNLRAAVTTGNSLTVASALEGIRKAAQMMEVSLEDSNIAILGATGAIGAACARILARDFPSLTLVARNMEKLKGLQAELQVGNKEIEVMTDSRQALPKADVVVTVTSAIDTVIEPEDIKPGAIICDVARPRDVSAKVAALRDDVLVFEGGVMAVPGEVEFNFNFGFPPRTSYACMAETMVLALEGRFESFSLGREMAVEQIDEIGRLAKKHGFHLAGLRSFEKPLDDAQIERIKDNVRKKSREAILRA
ncbi:MAG: shikimate dehydrogenase [Limnochordia bacterium]|jgi:fatty aldehyde-generating acyl-ACP reductase